ncbi:MAG TPA: hypothetical protein VMU84_02805 [Thermoanaerobaculia bacterium]|nr:hypothetical protein [Thermoanaerobaculia bacterium]
MAFDTSRRVAAAHAQLYRQIGPSERGRIAAELSDALRALALAGVRDRHPEYREEQVLEEVLAVFYGRGVDRP